MEQAIRFIGVDVHKETIAVTATRDVGKAAPNGTFPNTTAALEKLVKRLPRCCMVPVLMAGERAGTHIGEFHSPPWNLRLAVQILRSTPPSHPQGPISGYELTGV